MRLVSRYEPGYEKKGDFSSANDYEHFITVLKKTVEMFHLNVSAYCLLPITICCSTPLAATSPAALCTSTAYDPSVSRNRSQGRLQSFIQRRICSPFWVVRGLKIGSGKNFKSYSLTRMSRNRKNLLWVAMSSWNWCAKNSRLKMMHWCFPNVDQNILPGMWSFYWRESIAVNPLLSWAGIVLLLVFAV